MPKEDIFHKGSSVYEVDMNVISDKGKMIEKWDAGVKVYYVNTEGLTNKRINEYLKILSDSTTYNEKYKITSKTKKELFENGGLIMSTEFRKYIEKESKKSLKKGRQEGKIGELIELVKEGLLSAIVAAKRLGMSEEEFMALAK